MSDWREGIGHFQYPVPPLAEAVCQVSFGPAARQEGQDEFLKWITQSHPILRPSTRIEPFVQDDSSGPVHGFKHLNFSRYYNVDENRLVQLAENIVVVNDLPPYSEWPNFKARLLSVLDKYVEEFRPTSIGGLSLRYINQIKLPHVIVDLDDWFEYGLRNVPYLDNQAPMASFLVGTTRPVNLGILRIELKSLATNDDNVSVGLDIECLIQGASVANAGQLEAWFEEAHSLIEQSWLSCISRALHDYLIKGENK